jgi:hypothetical protein
LSGPCDVRDWPLIVCALELAASTIRILDPHSLEGQTPTTLDLIDRILFPDDCVCISYFQRTGIHVEDCPLSARRAA